jgi:dihydroflavonol-4-reductase
VYNPRITKFFLYQIRKSTLNADKYKIMKQRNWQCDISPLVEELGYRPEYPLDKGVKEIIAWYKKEGWL